MDGLIIAAALFAITLFGTFLVSLAAMPGFLPRAIFVPGTALSALMAASHWV